MKKLAEESVEKLREDLRLRRRVTVKAICDRYGISRTTVDRVRREMLQEGCKEAICSKT
ncbi:MAG: helix-turn-helix domain-containing protein [Steroidobacteraceae bacterium]